MILSVHQPQYLPWLGYFHKIAKSDLFIFLDDVQYKKREFQNRNKIKTPQGPHWLTVPVATKGQYTQLIKEVQVTNDDDWGSDHWKSIEHNYRKAPFFETHRLFFQELYARNWNLLIEPTMSIIGYALGQLNITTPRRLSSEFGVSTFSTQRIIDLCKATGADTYLSGAGGRDYMDINLFEENGIRLLFQDFPHPVYPQLHGNFEPYLCVADLLMNCGQESRKILLGEQRRDNAGKTSC